MTELPSKAKLTELVELGRGLASTLIENAVTDSEEIDGMNRQLMILQIAAQHVLAVMVFNFEKNNEGKDPKHLVEQYASGIMGEFLFVKENSHDMELVTPGQKFEKEDKGFH